MIILEPRVHFGASDEEMAKPRKWPCVAYIQDSAFHEQWMWNNISRHIRLTEQGYVVAIIEYRPSEVSPFPAQMQDAKTSMRFLRKNTDKYPIDAKRMAVAGDSSGGHTALMAGFTGDTQPDTDLYAEYSAEVKCIVDVYGPTVFALMNYYDSSQNHYLPDSPEGYEIGQKNVLENLELAEQTIPMNYLSKERSTPPTLIIHGSRTACTHDACAPARHSMAWENGKLHTGSANSIFTASNYRSIANHHNQPDDVCDHAPAFSY